MVHNSNATTEPNSTLHFRRTETRLLLRLSEGKEQAAQF
jgi:hypothetical protein